MWEIHSGDQAVTFLWSLLLGVLLCVFYDFFRAWRNVMSSRALSVAVQDIFFWLVSAVVTFLFMLARTGGEIRLFVLCGMAVGFSLFRFTLSRFTIIPFLLFFRAARFVSRKITAVYIVILTRLTALLNHFFTFCVKKYKNMRKVRKKLLKKGGGVLYTEATNESKDL